MVKIESGNIRLGVNPAGYLGEDFTRTPTSYTMVDDISPHGLNDLIIMNSGTGVLYIPTDQETLAYRSLRTNTFTNNDSGTEVIDFSATEGWGLRSMPDGELGYAVNPYTYSAHYTLTFPPFPGNPGAPDFHVDQDSGIGTTNISVISFTSDGVSAVSEVAVGSAFNVKHNFHPSPKSPSNAYEVTVTITNLRYSEVNAWYRRYLHPSIYIVESYNNVHGVFGDINGTALNTSNNNVLVGSTKPVPDFVGTFSPFDLLQHGIDPYYKTMYVSLGNNPNYSYVGDMPYFDFNFNLKPRESVTFNLYYGAVGTIEDAQSLESLLGLQLYSHAVKSVMAPEDPFDFLYFVVGVLVFGYIASNNGLGGSNESVQRVRSTIIGT